MSREESRRAYLRPHVLIVSDDPSLAQFLDEGLTVAGFWTSVIASGLQTLEVFRLRRFDIIIVDARLSGFDSLELVRRLRGTSDRVGAEAARSDAPLVFIAQDERELSSTTAATIGADAVYYAPLELEVLARELHRHFARWSDAHPETPLADVEALGVADR